MKLLARLLIFGEYFFLFESIKSSAGPIIAEVPQKNRQQSELNKNFHEIQPGFEWPLKLDEWNLVFKFSTGLEYVEEHQI